MIGRSPFIVKGGGIQGFEALDFARIGMPLVVDPQVTTILSIVPINRRDAERRRECKIGAANDPPLQQHSSRSRHVRTCLLKRAMIAVLAVPRFCAGARQRLVPACVA
jgi:hypothetical protein